MNCPNPNCKNGKTGDDMHPIILRKEVLFLSITSTYRQIFDERIQVCPYCGTLVILPDQQVIK